MLRRMKSNSGRLLRRWLALMWLAVALPALCPFWIEARNTQDLVPAQTAEQTAQETVTLPAGTTVYVRLDTPVSTKASHLGAPLEAHAVRAVPASGGLAIPVGSAVRGEIEKLIPSSSPTDRARVLLRFHRLEIPGEPAVEFSSRVTAVENARESVLANGTIQGLLASELPLSMIEKATAKLGKAGASSDGELQKQTANIFGKSDTSIDYPAGADLQMVLENPLELSQVFPNPNAEQLPAEIVTTIERLLPEAPKRVKGKDGKAGDPLNLVVVGSKEEIQHAFEAAGWLEPAKATEQSIWEATRAVIGNVGFGKAPVSDLYLFGRIEDLAFAKMLNTVSKRHHLRLWRSKVKTPDGREIWLGAATHDTGYDIRPDVISHAIDPDLDDERSKVGADLIAGGNVAAEQLVSRPDTLTEGLTATGASWKTDGQLLAIELKPVTPVDSDNNHR
jgi:LssY C-terminus